MNYLSSLEFIHSQLNYLDLFYQIKINKYSFCVLKKKFLLKNKNKLIKKNIFLCQYFFNVYLGKINVFIPSFFDLKPWIIFWLFNLKDLLNIPMSKKLCQKIYKFCREFFSDKRGVSSFNVSTPSLFILYPIILLRCICLTKNDFYNKKEIEFIYFYIRKLKIKNTVFRGSFVGDIDPRNIYCVFTISSLFNMLTKELSDCFDLNYNFFKNLDDSFSLEKTRESHGALSFCFLSSEIFYFNSNSMYFPSSCTKNWIIDKQKIHNNQFQGRTSKLTDSCYFFWLGSISIIFSLQFSDKVYELFYLYKERFLNGFCDKTGKTPDIYHTSYSVASLSFLNFFGKNHQMMNKLNPVFSLRESKIIFSFSFT